MEQVVFPALRNHYFRKKTVSYCKSQISNTKSKSDLRRMNQSYKGYLKGIYFFGYKFLRPVKMLDFTSMKFRNFEPNLHFADIKISPGDKKINFSTT